MLVGLWRGLERTRDLFRLRFTRKAAGSSLALPSLADVRETGVETE